MAIPSRVRRISALSARIASRSSGFRRDSRSSRSSIDGASAMIRWKACVVTHKPAGTRRPSIRESSPRCAPLPPTTATCVWSISWKPNTKQPIRSLLCAFSKECRSVSPDPHPAPLRLLGHLDLGSQAACCRIPPRALNTGCLSDQTASSVAPDEIFCPQRPAIGQLDVDAGVVLHETRHLTSAIDRHPQLADPAGQRALDVVLPQPEPVVVPSGKVADVQRDPG